MIFCGIIRRGVPVATAGWGMLFRFERWNKWGAPGKLRDHGGGRKRNAGLFSANLIAMSPLPPPPEPSSVAASGCVRLALASGAGVSALVPSRLCKKISVYKKEALTDAFSLRKLTLRTWHGVLRLPY